MTDAGTAAKTMMTMVTAGGDIDTAAAAAVMVIRTGDPKSMATTLTVPRWSYIGVTKAVVTMT